MNCKECGRKQPWPNLRYYHGICLEEMKRGKLSLDIQLPDQDLCPGFSQYVAAVLTTQLWHSIRGPIQLIKSQVIASIKEADFFAIQLDESTDITEKAQLLAFSKLVCNGDTT
jgi:hypothetical protein